MGLYAKLSAQLTEKEKMQNTPPIPPEECVKEDAGTAMPEALTPISLNEEPATDSEDTATPQFSTGTVSGSEPAYVGGLCGPEISCQYSDEVKLVKELINSDRKDKDTPSTQVWLSDNQRKIAIRLAKEITGRAKYGDGIKAALLLAEKIILQEKQST